MKEKPGLIEYVAIFGVVVIAVAMFMAIKSTGEHIGIQSAMKLSICAPYLTDEQCIGKEKAQIIADLQNDGNKVHGVQMFHGNAKEENSLSTHEQQDLVNHPRLTLLTGSVKK